MKKGILALMLTSLVGSGMNLALADSDDYRGHEREYGERYHGKEDRYCNKTSKYRLESMREELDLTDEQVEQLSSIREKYKPRMHELREKSKANREKLREAKQTENVDMGKLKSLAKEQGEIKTQKIILKAEKRNEIQSVLTKDQFQKLKKMKYEYRKHRDHEEHEHYGKDS